ncbi:MAG: hypothetical protein JWN01_165 [Patescibacteria group bacterium]|nr:hypothetical protein [Patescibacteria group bacterium]
MAAVFGRLPRVKSCKSIAVCNQKTRGIVQGVRVFLRQIWLQKPCTVQRKSGSLPRLRSVSLRQCIGCTHTVKNGANFLKSSLQELAL